ncbi:hypothetical protein MAIT1_02003 [Magnetofaba australis IT-1]|uniref:Uncharacterized protein n=1 Tax=Magnetofaba australis IT-1 TaxID=1434232 RepID=A0A1Y2K2Q3_9PROT|nr:hypothetical protein MAIT1_02003 [Magnetofaba australis IT-1]
MRTCRLRVRVVARAVQSRVFGQCRRLPVVMAPRAVAPIGTLRAQRHARAVARQMLRAIAGEPFAQPDVANALLRRAPHVRAPGDVKTTQHHIAAGVDVQTFEQERAGHVAGVDIRLRIRRPVGIEGGVVAPGEEFAADEVVHPHPLHPEAFRRIQVHPPLRHAGDHNARNPAQRVAQLQQAREIPHQRLPVEPDARFGVGGGVAGVDGDFDHLHLRGEQGAAVGLIQQRAVGDQPHAATDLLGVGQQLNGLWMQQRLAAARNAQVGGVGARFIGDGLEQRCRHIRRIPVTLADIGLRVGAVRTFGVARIDQRKHQHHGVIHSLGAHSVALLGVARWLHHGGLLLHGVTGGLGSSNRACAHGRRRVRFWLERLRWSQQKGEIRIPHGPHYSLGATRCAIFPGGRASHGYSPAGARRMGIAPRICGGYAVNALENPKLDPPAALLSPSPGPRLILRHCLYSGTPAS